MVHLNIDRPTKGLEVEMKYDASIISSVRLMDFASRGDGGLVSQEIDAAVLRYRYDGWLFPRAGLVFAWTLVNEEQGGAPRQETARTVKARSSGRSTRTAVHQGDARHTKAA